MLKKLTHDDLIEDLLNNYEDTDPHLFCDSGKEPIKEIIIFGPYGQVGIAVIRLALSRGIKVIAVTHTRTVSFSNPMFSAVNVEELDYVFAKGNKKVVFTGPINKIHEYKKYLNKASHLICFSSTSRFTKSDSSSEFYKNIVSDLVTGEEEVIKLSESNKFRFNILRPTLIYGFGIDSNVTAISKFIGKYKIFPIYKNGSGLRQPVHLEDLANSVISLFHAGKKSYNKEYNLSGGETLSYYQMVKKIFLAQNQTPIIFKTKFLPFFMEIANKFSSNQLINKEVVLNMEKDFVFSHIEAQKDFNYSPRKFLEDPTKNDNLF